MFPLDPLPGFAFAGALAPNAGGAIMTDSAVAPSPVKAVGKVRSIFPETWLWTNTSVG